MVLYERELPVDSTVMRLVRHVETLFPPGSTRPTTRAFALSSDDLEESRRRGVAPLLSVFDTDRTTVQQAMALRGAIDPMTAFGLPVAGICAIVVPPRPLVLPRVRRLRSLPRREPAPL